MRRLVLLGVYLCLLPIITLALIGCLTIMLRFGNTSQTTAQITSSDQFQAIPEQTIATTYVSQESEARIEVLTQFFKRYNSPLQTHVKTIIETADKYSIDWRLIPAIAMQESTLCQKIPKNSFNCWGFGIYGGKVTRFKDYDEAIEIVTKTLANTYKAQGLTEPHEIVTKYTPGSTSWAKNVSYVMDRIQSSL